MPSHKVKESCRPLPTSPVHTVPSLTHHSCPHCDVLYPPLLPTLCRLSPIAPALTVPSYTHRSCPYCPVPYPPLLSTLLRPLPTTPALTVQSFTHRSYPHCAVIAPAHTVPSSPRVRSLTVPPVKHSRIVNRFVNVLTFTELREQNPRREYGCRFRIGRQHPDSCAGTAAAAVVACWRRCWRGSGVWRRPLGRPVRTKKRRRPPAGGRDIND